MRISDWSSDVCSSDLRWRSDGPAIRQHQTCTGAATVHDHQGAEKGSGSTTDPVCGMTVDPAIPPHIATHGGVHNYFCSAGCLAKFEVDPDRYAVTRELAAADALVGAIWTSPMHPELQQAGPGRLHICGLALEPVIDRPRT